MPAGLTMAAVALAALGGVVAGVGGYTFVYARGSSYLTDDPASCANCHAMQAYYDGWIRGPHHAAAVCNDCHTPSHPLSKYLIKAVNGWHHSQAFTAGGYPDAIVIRERSREVVEGQCRRCHASMVAAMPGAGETSCLRCHRSAGHLR